MADNVEHEVSSTTPFYTEEVHHYQAEPEPQPDPPKQDLFSLDDIVDLVGGAHDALNRHIAEDNASHEFTETHPADSVSEVPEPGPDSTSYSFLPDTSEVVAPKAEPESAKIEPEPLSAPESDALPVVEPWKAAPAPAEAAERPAVTEEPSAPSSYVTSPSKAQPLPLMQFPTELGQKGDSPAPISPLSPVHSPDSLEELSLTESPNQPPTLGSAAPLGSLSIDPSTARTTLSKEEMPWLVKEGGSGPGCSQNKNDLPDPQACPYLSLGKEPGPHNPCEDSGVSFSPEEKLLGSNKSSSGPSPVNPKMMVPESHFASSNPTEYWDSNFLKSEDNSKVSMDSFSKDMAPISSRYEEDLLGNQSDEEDDLMNEVKKNINPFEGYSPLADSGFSPFGESKSESGASKMSESPTPDLVQYGQTGESQDTPPSFLDEAKSFEMSKNESANQFLAGFKDDEEEDSALPPSLPDILKSSPLNPDKLDSGSSEGSPEEQSPIFERRMMESPNPPINLSANNPFAFDAKVSLLREMTEEMEVKAKSDITKEDELGALDLVKEAEETTPTKVKEEEPVEIEQKDWFSSNDSPRMKEKFEPLDLKGKNTNTEDSDSESPTADSLSPVLEAMAKNPAIFQVETEKTLPMDVEEAELAEEVSEHEVSSEEFEFIERPPKGVIDEFLEALDTSKLTSTKPPEIPLDDDLILEQQDLASSASASLSLSGLKEEAQGQTYHLLTQASPQKSKADLEKLDTEQAPLTSVPTQSSPHQPEEVIHQKSTEAGKVFKVANLNIRAVVDLVYWRDVKTTGVVFGAALLLLLSLMACSIVSVISYIGLALLSVTISFRIYKGILQAIQKSDEGHPFKQYLDQEVALPEDMVHKYSDMVLAKLNKTIAEVRRLFLVEDLVDSIKFAVLMWILTYVGALFNGLTLLILGLIAVFSCPIVYEKHQAQIDHYLSLVNNQVKDIVGKIQAKVPGMKRKTE
ncbi:reticulon-4a isoform X2 [Takifugu rubripes]|uniref:Reticulon n=1 Tax=Takifugu rubripes TaxID=31033 RepID=A0A3B5KN91_TAKRU|nr:reticulon-4 isoform X2 [Takifugu rubripes]